MSNKELLSSYIYYARRAGSRNLGKNETYLSAWHVITPCEELAIVGMLLNETPIACKLTRAEQYVMELLVRGLSNEDISVLRGTSVHTVANQVSSIFKKLGVFSRSELLALKRFHLPDLSPRLNR